jgi:hypothetical protein
LPEVRRLREFVTEHPSGSRQFLHGVLLGTVLGVVATATAGAIPWSLAVIWFLLYLLAALVLELLLVEPREAPIPHVYSGSDFAAVSHALMAEDELIATSDRIELLSGTLKTFTERSANIAALYQRHRTGVPVRLLLMSPQGEGLRIAAAERRDRGGGIDVDDLRREINQSVERLLLIFPFKELKQVLRFYAGSPHSAVARYGEQYILTVYTFGRGGSSPSIALQRPQHTDFCKGLDLGFHELWNAESTVALESLSGTAGGSGGAAGPAS